MFLFCFADLRDLSDCSLSASSVQSEDLPLDIIDFISNATEADVFLDQTGEHQQAIYGHYVHLNGVTLDDLCCLQSVHYENIYV